MDEIQAPCVVQLFGLTARFPMNRHLPPAGPFCPQTQAFFTVEPVDDVLANLPALALQHDMDTPISETDSGRHNLMHALAQLGQRIRPERLPLCRAMLARQTAGLSLAVAVRLRHVINNLFHERWPGNFFDSTS